MISSRPEGDAVVVIATGVIGAELLEAVDADDVEVAGSELVLLLAVGLLLLLLFDNGGVSNRQGRSGGAGHRACTSGKGQCLC